MGWSGCGMGVRLGKQKEWWPSIYEKNGGREHRQHRWGMWQQSKKVGGCCQNNHRFALRWCPSALLSPCPFVFPSSKPFKWETGGTGAFTLSLFGKQTCLSATSKKCGVMDCLLFGLGCYSVIIVVVAVAQQLNVRKQQRNRKTSFLFENEQWKWLQQSPRKNHVVNKTLIARGSLAFWDSLHKFKQTGTQGTVHVSLFDNVSNFQIIFFAAKTKTWTESRYSVVSKPWPFLPKYVERVVSNGELWMNYNAISLRSWLPWTKVSSSNQHKQRTQFKKIKKN